MERDAILLAVGLNEKDIFNLTKNEALTTKFLRTITEVNIPLENKSSEFNYSCGPLILKLIQSIPDNLADNRLIIAKYIAQGKLKTGVQVEEAIKYAKKIGTTPLPIQDFEVECGVGADVNEEKVTELVNGQISSNKLSYYTIGKANVGKLVGTLRNEIKLLKFADGNIIKQVVEKAFQALSEELKDTPVEEAPKKVEKVAVVKTATTTEKVATQPQKKTYNFDARFLETAVNPPELLEQHKNQTGGKIMTRFPPEPNGFLHIGHAKAMNLSFGYAMSEGGCTYLRYDDTNPEKEEKIYFDSIREMMEWMGFKPFKITYTSDYMDQMYDFAVQLIKEGKAYVDFSSKKEIHDQRENKIESKYRNTTPEENLKRFEQMKMGIYDEGAAVLRVKIDMSSDNYNMRDFVAYRIKYVAHPHQGNKWCIYPTYDFSHCIVDSLENITHSLCTLEFENRRDSYYWLLATLKLYRPHVYEFSRLNITTALLSKRKVLKLVKEKIIRSWDDPRVLTLAGLRRRGYTPEGIKSFCDDIGVTRVENLIPIERLEQSLRTDLDERVNRVFAVLEPLKVVLTNYDANKVEHVEAKNHPKLAERGSRQLPLSRVLYIESSDFREVDSEDYYGLAPNKSVGLRYAPCNIHCEKVIKDENGKIVELHCTADFDKKEKPKTYIHWLSQSAPGVDPMKAEVRLYEKLFTCDDLDEVGDEWLNYINPNSEIIKPNAFVDPYFQDAKNRAVYEKYQFERVGFFVVDQDTTNDQLVFNRSVTLKVDNKFKSK
ncbi:predicted protein [Naegleria gruberi]|uniref:glutamine--tRNA ligase n=1 Tax=Naegleria gruberi TaxID=5762 RepID=D2W2H0_NAEGR|nr:uncharacterized protein NAEGRDRAFT_83344 [Naegleria gruberi]EFC36745.1 predicted protein [Naegleria gruberi]|eukprot:XP_002669489.1 predicted protein [Naegleria gruberi strain NEG-M]